MAPEHRVVTEGSALRAPVQRVPRPGVAGSPWRVKPFPLRKLPGLQADRWAVLSSSCMSLRADGKRGCQLLGGGASSHSTHGTQPGPAGHHCSCSQPPLSPEPQAPFPPRDETCKALGSPAKGNCQRGDCHSSHGGWRATHHEPRAPHVWAASS